MIELRWIERDVGWTDGINNYSTPKQTLQYREGTYEHSRWVPHKQDYEWGGKYWHGTEWQDVPVVKEVE